MNHKPAAGSPHIVYVLKVYPRLSETFIVNEILELERQGARVTIVSLKSPREGRFHAKLARVRADVIYLPELDPADLVERLAADRARVRTFLPRLGPVAWEAIESGERDRVWELAKAVDLALRLQDLGADHMHAHFATSAAAVAMLASGLSGVPYSFTAHAKDIYIDGVDRGRLEARMRRASFVVTVCDANRVYLESLDHGDTPILRIYNGIDLDEFRPAPSAGRGGRFEILGVGRLIPKKGFDTLVRAARLLDDGGLDFRCRIIGGGSEYGSLRALIDAEGVSHRVELLGPLPDTEVRDAMNASDLFALPARIDAEGNRDALPTVLLESLALGVCTLSTPVTGIPEILANGAAGELVPEDRPDLLAETILRLSADAGARRRLAEAGRARALELFDVRRNVALLLDQFRGRHAARLS